MAENRSAFSRKYTSFTKGGTQVWLVNGAGLNIYEPTGSGSPIGEFPVASGDVYPAGSVVYVSGQFATPASAASGLGFEHYNVVGIATDASTGASGSTVTVALDGVVSLTSGNISHQVALTPGDYYFLSTETGKVVNRTSASGIDGSTGYGTATVVGIALSTTDLNVEIEPAIITNPSGV